MRENKEPLWVREAAEYVQDLAQELELGEDHPLISGPQLNEIANKVFDEKVFKDHLLAAFRKIRKAAEEGRFYTIITFDDNVLKNNIKEELHKCGIHARTLSEHYAGYEHILLILWGEYSTDKESGGPKDDRFYQ